jgi:hypothetical protein
VLLTLVGVDVSQYQTSWTPESGISFAFVRATKGNNHKDEAYTRNLAAARAAGLVVGHYHFQDALSPVADQVQWFLANSDIRDGDMIVWDWEVRDAGHNPILKSADKDYALKTLALAKPHCQVGLYTGRNYWEVQDETGFFGDFLWMAYYSELPPPHPWTFWQYVDGKNHPTGVDHNKANFTTKSELLAWARARIPKEPVVTANIINTGGALLPEINSIAREIESHLRTKGYVLTTIYGTTTWPDHQNLRCLDFMISTSSSLGKAAGDAIAAYIIANAARLRVNWFIWYGRIWRRLDLGKGQGWDTYYGTNKHYDHVHLECAAGTYVPPPDVPLPPPPPPYPIPTTKTVYASKLIPGQQNSDSVWWVQKSLNKISPTLVGGKILVLNGDYDAATVAQVKLFQKQKCYDYPDGDIGPRQATVLFKLAGYTLTIV